ncbi:MAG: membrane dipeptidase [Candidatus Bathyarchaeia archaeon]
MLRSYLELSRDEEEHALALHRESIVIDASIVPFIHHVGEDIWIDDVLKGGVTASNATVCMQRSIGEALRELSEYHDWIEKHGEKALLVRRASDIELAKRDGRHGIILGPQNSSFLEGNLRFLDLAWDWGIRIIQLSYNERNEAADGCGERTDAGLSNFGAALVEAMNRRGVLIDLSHVGDRSTLEAIELSKDPVAFTHVCPRSSTPMELSPYATWAGGEAFLEYARRRGKTDEALKACAEKGGVIGVTPFFAKKAGPSTLTDDTLDQIDYVVDLVGVDHVGFGSDVDFRNSVTRLAYIQRYPDRVDRTYHTPMTKEWGYGWLEHMPNLTKGLIARGYSDTEVKKILGLNFLNLFRRVWRE